MTFTFPPDFRFGVADSDLQVIGERYTRETENSQPTMWDHFARTSGKCLNNQTPAEGANRYELWKEDAELIQSLGIKHYRTSISIARLLTKEGEPNPHAVKWYRDFFTALRDAGVSVYACLYHWELPLDVSEKGGWESRDIVELMATHADTAISELGDLIDEYFLINEPWCIAFLSYHLGKHAPGNTDLSKALLAAHHVLLASACMEEVIRKKDPDAKIDICVNSQPSYALTSSPEDLLAATYADEYFNLWFTEPIFTGKYPENLQELLGSSMPDVSRADMRQIQFGQRVHALAVNFYQGDTVTFDPDIDVRYRPVLREGGETTGVGWPIYLPPTYPDGLYDILHQFYHSFSRFGLKRMYVSENGLALETPWDGKSEMVADPGRIQYLSGHIAQVEKAITSGLPVVGYFAWTLLDNYEWEHGYSPNSCFGLVHVDRKTMRRIPKQSASWYRDLIRNRIRT